ncbi:hypothetical protein AWC38_SpisGene8975 [Stylophora pistillata]|uniref:Uncharacterized protein n=1 Tax=Stylophora pistillata TaxID=50429 RepID=A0A2B4SBE8_STYPI|nr:hypothetical protein AWC38_SpisGene8975 [Stylophora pistillata]
MSNSPLRNAGFETLPSFAAFDDPDFEDDLFGGIPSFTQDIWTNSKYKEMDDDDDLPLTKYLLQFNDDERWSSEEELSKEEDSFEYESGGFGWDIHPIVFADGDDSGLTQDTPDKPKQEKEEVVMKKRNSVEKSTKVKKSDHEERIKCGYDLDEKEGLKKNNSGKNNAKFHSVQSSEKSIKSVAQCKEVVKKSANSTAQQQKSLTTSKTQAEKAKQQRERKKNCSVLQDGDVSDGKANKRKVNDHAEDSSEKVCNMQNKRNKKRKMEESSGDKVSSFDVGVCVHVQSGKVSLEFCAECSKKANGVIN